MNGFQGSWPAIEAFNQQMAVFKGQGVPYAQIIENLRQSDFLQRNHDLLVSPAVQIYETCSSLPDIVSTCAQTLDVLAPIESIIASINGIRLLTSFLHSWKLFCLLARRKSFGGLISGNASLL